MNFIEELKWRGMIHDMMPGTEEQMQKEMTVGYLGIDTSALTALIASFGVCIGLAVNGALSNLAGGVLILVTRPFKVDDFIEAQGVSGTVTDINMTATRVVTPDNKVVYLPNGALSGGNIINYSEKDTRRVDITFAISASSDVNKAVEIVKNVWTAHALVFDDPAPFVRINENGDSCQRITSRGWVKSSDYWTVYFDVLEQVKAESEADAIEKGAFENAKRDAETLIKGLLSSVYDMNEYQVHFIHAEQEVVE